MKNEKVILPTEEDLAEFAEFGYQHQKKRGRGEMAMGVVALVVSILTMSGFHDLADVNENRYLAHERFYGFVFGLILFAVGLSRQFRGKR